MKTKSMMAFGALLAPMMAAGTAQANESYVSVNGGYVGETEYDYDASFGSVAVKAEPGYAIEGAFGSRFATGWRGEVALGYRVQNKAEPDAWFLDKGDGVKALTVDLNGYYDFAPAAAFSPYLGAGVGVASLNVDDGVVDDTGDALHLQFMGGATYTLSERVKLFGEARWEQLSYKVETEFDEEFEVDMSGLGFRAGLRFGF